MRIEEHQESFEEHKETIFRWALEVKGLEKSQRIIGLHASRAIIDLLSVYLLKKGKISPGKQINHRWFKSQKVTEKIPEFENNKKLAILGTKVPSISREFFGIENSSKVRGIKPTIFNKNKIVNKIVELELLCERLTYGSKRPLTEIKKTLELFNEIEKGIEELENAE